MIKFEICKMLTISTCHITEKTSFLLDKNADNVPPVYKKGNYGWFVYVGDIDYEIPEDLKKCCELAINNGCDWLCLDCDGPVVDVLETFELETFEWS